MKVENSKLLRDVFTAVSTIVDEATFRVTPEGIQLVAMDPARAATVDFMMQRTAFQEYKADRRRELCFSTGYMVELLGRARSGEPAQVSLDEETGQLRVLIRGAFTRRFYMPTLEPTGGKAVLPEAAFHAQVMLTTDMLRRALSRLPS